VCRPSRPKDGSAIDFMALTMIDPASSWFEIVELPLVTWLTIMTVNGKEKVSKELIFDKSSNQIARLVNKIWLCRYLQCRHLLYDNGSSSNYTLKHYVIHTAYNVSQPQLRILKRMPYVSASIQS
jgi:hypothetical protein